MSIHDRRPTLTDLEAIDDRWTQSHLAALRDELADGVVGSTAEELALDLLLAHGSGTVTIRRDDALMLIDEIIDARTRGGTVTLTYRRGYADVDIVVGDISERHPNGDFEFEPSDGTDGWTVLAVEIARGDVAVDPKQVDR